MIALRNRSERWRARHAKPATDIFWDSFPVAVVEHITEVCWKKLLGASDVRLRRMMMASIQGLWALLMSDAGAHLSILVLCCKTTSGIFTQSL